MKSLNEAVMRVVFKEGVNHDNEVVNTINHIRDNLKFDRDNYGALVMASAAAEEVSKHDEDSPSYKEAHDHFMHALDNLQQHNMTASHDYEPTGFKGDMFKTAKNHVKTWIENGKFGQKDRVDYEMTAMHLGDAADYLMLAHHVANEDKPAFIRKAWDMDTAARDEIPGSVWYKWYGHDH